MNTDLERRLAAALAQEAEHAMTLTNTPQELQRFRETVTRRTRRTRVLLVAASIVAVIGLVLAVTQLGGDKGTLPADDQPGPTVVLPSHELGDPQPLAGSTTTVSGPFSTGDPALGFVWAVSGDETRGVLHRISPDGRTILSQTQYDGLNPEHQQVTRVGSRVAVVNGAGTAYDLFDATGRRVGTVPAEQARGAAGDASGGWLVTSANTVARVSAQGTPTGLVVTLPDSALVISVATGGDALWALNVDGTLYKVDARTGAVGGSAQVVTANPLQVVWAQDAVFVATADYDVTRIDSATLKATDVLRGNRAWSFQILSVGTDGSLWSEPAKGAVAELDAGTLTVKRFVQAFPNDRQGGGTFGLAVTGDRVFLSDGDTSTLHSFAR